MFFNCKFALVTLYHISSFQQQESAMLKWFWNSVFPEGPSLNLEGGAFDWLAETKRAVKSVISFSSFNQKSYDTVCFIRLFKRMLITFSYDMKLLKVWLCWLQCAHLHRWLQNKQRKFVMIFVRTCRMLSPISWM